MALSTGTQLGSYEILAPLGAGGMGEVYRARDSKLGREVAIKVLPEEFTQHPQKLARFEREARLLAALNHPNIATLYGVEEFQTKPFLVMELVEGQTLADRISLGPIPVGEALEISRQIAEALEAAHEKGVIHRDLKPANIKVDPEGKVKVLDFGLAKAFADEVPESELSQSPTLSRDATRAGVILGTAAYMSPEQAKGKTVDKRSDIFSFGLVLYEMLAGKKAFAGEDVSDVLASIIKMEPDWKTVPAGIDRRIDNLLRRCLRKDRKNRLQAIGDARVAIEEIVAEPEVRSDRSTAQPALLPWAVAGILAVVSLVTLWVLWPSVEPPRPPVRLSVNLGAGEAELYTGPGEMVTVSADGRMLSFVGRNAEGNAQIYTREFDNLEAIPLSGAENGFMPFFSPDGRWLAFFSRPGILKRVPIEGGTPLTTAELVEGWGGSWGPEDTIVYAPSATAGLHRVSASGGTPEALTTLQEGEVSHRWPSFLPKGKTVLFTVQTVGVSRQDATLEALILDTGERKVIHKGGTYPRYASSGHLLFGRDDTLFAMPFDADRVETSGEPRPVLDGVRVSPGGEALFAVTEGGTLIYVPSTVPAGAPLELVWVDRQGVEQSATETLRPYLDPRLSPDGQHLVVRLRDDGDLWVLDLMRGGVRRLTFGEDSEGNSRPVWSPDGERIFFGSNRGGEVGTYDVYSTFADGSGAAEQLTSGAYRVPTSISSDGKTLVFRQNSVGTGRDIGMVRFDGDREPEMLLQTRFEEDTGMLSPDDRWLAYVSNESGREEVYVTPFDNPGGKVPISTEGGTEPMWSRDGRELFYRNGEKMMAVTISTGAGFSAGRPTLLFEGDYESGTGIAGNPGTNYDVAPDGRFLMIRTPSSDEITSAKQQVHVVFNWFEELKRLVPTN